MRKSQIINKHTFSAMERIWVPIPRNQITAMWVCQTTCNPKTLKVQRSDPQIKLVDQTRSNGKFQVQEKPCLNIKVVYWEKSLTSTSVPHVHSYMVSHESKCMCFHTHKYTCTIANIKENIIFVTCVIKIWKLDKLIQ